MLRAVQPTASSHRRNGAGGFGLQSQEGRYAGINTRPDRLVTYHAAIRKGNVLPRPGRGLTLSVAEAGLATMPASKSTATWRLKEILSYQGLRALG